MSIQGIADSVPYLNQVVHIYKNIIPIQAATAESACYFSLAYRVLEGHGIEFFDRPQSFYDRTNAELKRDVFVYDNLRDVYICSNQKLLKASMLHRSASGLYWKYLADKQDCQGCLRQKCLSEDDRQGARKLEHSYFAPERQRHLARRHDTHYQNTLKKQ